MILRLVVFLCTGWICRVNGNQYIYVNESKTWEDARGYCKQKGFELSTLNGQEIDICNLTEVTELWTNNYIYTTPYLSLLGCYSYKKPDEMQFYSLENASVLECQILCSESKRFAIQNHSCTCIQTDSEQGPLQNAEQCNYTCDGRVICGGANVISIYEKANISDLLTERPLFPPTNSRCLVYQCENGAVNYKESDCKNKELANDDNYFSCSFEPDIDCFLWQANDNDLKWSIQNSLPQNSPNLDYTASYYAHVNGSGASGQKAVLISRITFKAADWCLRFRYFTNKTLTMDVIIWDIIADRNHSLVKISNSTYTLNTQTAWYLVERNIIMRNDFKLVFKFNTTDRETYISIDDVTMIADSCNKTVSTMLNKGRGIHCTFDGNFDVCFRQDELNDTTNWNLSNNQRWLLTGNADDNAILISKFELNDIEVNISMKFSAEQNLELYLIDNQGKKKNVIEMNESDGDITLSRNIMIGARSNLYLRGFKTSKQLKIYFIKIKVIPKSNSEGVKQQFQTLNPYAMTLSDVSNLRCLVGGVITMSKTIKLLGNLTRNGKPSAVKIYGKNDSFWEIFDLAKSRTFVCEQDSRSNNKCEILADFIPQRVDVQNTNTVWIAAVIGCLLVFIIVCISSITVYKRKRFLKNNQNTKDPSTGVQNSIKLTYEKVEGTKNDNVEEDYDHLHQNQTSACASSSENVYSHTTDNQYGVLPVITDDTYDHTVGREGEYGAIQVCQDSENTYDHT